MPKGIYARRTDVRYGKPATCDCGGCAKCKQRTYNHRHYSKIRKSRGITEDALEQRMVEYFKSKGWD